jgi:transcriptional regulator with XRE-family HTH domain
MEDQTRAAAAAAVNSGNTTNVAIAEQLGVDHSTVSRIRSGQRYPSRELMRRIAEKFGWKVVHQLDLLPDRGRNLRYAQEFERKVCK